MTSIRDTEDNQREHPSVARNLGLVVAGIAIVGSVFTAGYNWRSVDVMEKDRVQDREQYVRKDVQAQQFNYINYQLAELSKQVERLSAELEKRRQ